MELLYLVFIVFGGAGAVIGLTLGGFFAGSGPRDSLLIVLGVVLVVAALVAHANTHELPDCHDCSEFAGGAIHPLEAIGAVANATTWTVGVVAASLVKRLRARRASFDARRDAGRNR